MKKIGLKKIGAALTAVCLMTSVLTGITAVAAGSFDEVVAINDDFAGFVKTRVVTPPQGGAALDYQKDAEWQAGRVWGAGSAANLDVLNSVAKDYMEFIPKASGSGILMRQFASAPLTGVETVDISVDLQSVDSVGDMFTFALSDTGNTTAKRFTLFERKDYNASSKGDYQFGFFGAAPATLLGSASYNTLNKDQWYTYRFLLEPASAGYDITITATRKGTSDPITLVEKKASGLTIDQMKEQRCLRVQVNQGTVAPYELLDNLKVVIKTPANQLEAPAFTPAEGTAMAPDGTLTVKFDQEIDEVTAANFEFPKRQAAVKAVTMNSDSTGFDVTFSELQEGTDYALKLKDMTKPGDETKYSFDYTLTTGGDATTLLYDSFETYETGALSYAADNTYGRWATANNLDAQITASGETQYAALNGTAGKTPNISQPLFADNGPMDAEKIYSFEMRFRLPNLLTKTESARMTLYTKAGLAGGAKLNLFSVESTDGEKTLLRTLSLDNGTAGAAAMDIAAGRWSTIRINLYPDADESAQYTADVRLTDEQENEAYRLVSKGDALTNFQITKEFIAKANYFRVMLASNAADASRGIVDVDYVSLRQVPGITMVSSSIDSNPDQVLKTTKTIDITCSTEAKVDRVESFTVKQGDSIANMTDSVGTRVTDAAVLPDGKTVRLTLNSLDGSAVYAIALQGITNKYGVSCDDLLLFTTTDVISVDGPALAGAATVQKGSNKVQATVTNLDAGAPCNAALIIVVYQGTEDGYIIDQIQMDQMTGITDSGAWDVDFTLDELEGRTVKAYVWDDMNHMVPLKDGVLLPMA